MAKRTTRTAIGTNAAGRRAHAEAPRPVIPAAPPRESVAGGRWKLGRPLSPRGNTLLAVGPGPVNGVVKLAPDPGDPRLAELVRHEFVTLTEIGHTNIERVLGHGVEPDGVPWFAVERLDGASLLESTAPLRGGSTDAPAPITDYGALGDVWAQACRALEHLHARGLVHGDVTASNLLICPRPKSPDGSRHRAVLVDLGLSQPEHRVLHAGEVRGTPGFLAPELLLGSPPSRLTDCYALAAAMHVAITGAPPFPAEDFDGLLAQQRVGLPIDFAARHPGVPLAFEAVMRRCLAPDPAARPPSANAVIRELNGYLGTLHPEEPPPATRAGTGFGRPPLTGRASDLAALRHAADPRADGPPALVLAGPAGVGRTRLLEEWQVRCELDGLAVARATVHGRDPRPLGPLGDCIGQMAERLGPEFRARHTALLTELALADAHGAPANEPGEAADARAERLMAAALDAAATRDWVCCLDDAESLGDSHLAALAHVLRGLLHHARLQAGPAPRLRFVLAWRTAQGGAASLPDALTRPEALAAVTPLGPLAVDDARELFAWALHGADLPPAVVGTLPPDEPAGPRAVLARARSLFEQGVLRNADGAWRVDRAALEKWQPPRRDTEALEREVVGLNPTARQLLTACAMFERPVPVTVLLGLSRADAPAAAAAVSNLVRRGLLGLVQDEGQASVVVGHPADRGALLRGHSGAARTGLAQRAFEALRGHSVAGRPAYLDELARLAVLARDGTQAPTTALAAAAQLRATGRLPEALRLLDGALDVLTRRDPRRAELEERAFEIEVFQGRLDAARARLARLGQPASRAEGARRYLALARLAAAGDRRDELEAAVRDGLALAADAAPVVAAALHERHAFFLGKAGETDHARQAAARADVLLEGQTGSEAEGLRDDVAMRRAMLWNATGQRAEAVAALRSVAERARVRGDWPRARFAHGNLGMVLRDTGRFAEAAEAAREGLDAATRSGSASSRATSLEALGNVLDDLGDLRAAQEHLREAAALSVRLGHRLRGALALHNLGVVLGHEGDLGQAVSMLRLALDRRIEAGAPALAAHTATQLARYASDAGDLKCAQAMLERLDGEWAPHVEKQQSRSWSHGGRASLLEALGQRDAAIEAWRRAAEISEYRAAGTSSLFDARAAILLAQRGDVVAARALLADRPPAAEWEDQVSVRWAHAAASLAEGDVSAARARVADAARALPAQAGGDWRAGAHYWNGRLADASGDWPAADDAYDAAWEQVRAAARTVPTACQAAFLAHPWRAEIRQRAEHARRQARALRPDRAGDLTAEELARLSACTLALGRELRVEPLLDCILDEAVALTGAARAFLILRQADGTLRFHAARRAGGAPVAEPDQAVSTSIARQAMERGAVLCTADAAGDPRFQPFLSVHRLQLRSVLCQPLALPSGPVGCLYLDHPLAAGAFGPHAQAVVAAFAAHAAVAVHAAGVVAARDAALREAEALRAQLEDALQLRDAQLRAALAAGGAPPGAPETFEGLVGQHPAMREVFRLVAKFAASDLPVTILGESGTGKELVARAIHRRSARAGGPLVSENVAALTPTLAAAELFGHVRGAFTGADRDRPGLFQLAHGGTLFLDEVGDLHPDVQTALLRAIEQREVRRVGADAPEPVDVRVVCATNRDLVDEVHAGRFREDLWYRLRVLVLELPPLRERLEDVPLLAAHIRTRIARERGRCPELTPQALMALAQQAWPGNVRQLENEIRRAAVVAGAGPILPSHLSPEIARERTTPVTDPTFDEARERGFWETISALETRLLRRAIELAQGNQSEAARLLKMDRVTLIRKSIDLGIAPSVPGTRRGRPKGRRTTPKLTE